MPPDFGLMYSHHCVKRSSQLFAHLLEIILFYLGILAMCIFFYHLCFSLESGFVMWFSEVAFAFIFNENRTSFWNRFSFHLFDSDWMCIFLTFLNAKFFFLVSLKNSFVYEFIVSMHGIFLLIVWWQRTEQAHFSVVLFFFVFETQHLGHFWLINIPFAYFLMTTKNWCADIVSGASCVMIDFLYFFS